MRTVPITTALVLAVFATGCGDQAVLPTGSAAAVDAEAPVFELPEAPILDAPSENEPAATSSSVGAAVPQLAISKTAATDNGYKLFVVLDLDRATLGMDTAIERCPDDGHGAPDIAGAVTRVMSGGFHGNVTTIAVLDFFLLKAKGGTDSYWYRARHFDAQGQSAWSAWVEYENH